MTEKPLVFVSYASPDEELAKFIGSQIESVLSTDRIDVFVSTIDAGEKWFPTIQEALDRCEALVVLITPASIDRRWVWFEIGYVWAKTRDVKRHIYPLALSRAQEIPHPLSEHQGKFLDSKRDIENFFEQLCEQFGFGEPENANNDLLIEKALNSLGYLAPENLSELEIRDLLTAHLRNELDSKQKLIRYSQVDKDLNLPRGSSAKYLKDVAQKTGFTVLGETENTITLFRRPKTAQVRPNPIY